MSGAYLAGLFWLLLAGIMQGAFPLPMKYTRWWKWEHLWFWYSLFAFVLLPVLAALLTVPKLGGVYRGLALAPILWTILFGFTWGVGSVLYGLGIDALGMTLGFPMMTALTTALGAFIPMAVLTPALVFQRSGILTMTGNLVTILGVAVCAVAGGRRDLQLGRTVTAAILGPGRSFTTALVICVLAGVLSAMFNFGYAFGEPIVRAATAQGATKDNALNAMWLIMLPAGGIVNIGYCLFLCRRNRSGAALVSRSWMDWVSSSSMAILWTVSVIIYGWGANALGRLGATLGWSLWNAILIATTVIFGLLTGEWEGVHGRPVTLLWIGIAIMIAGMFVLGAGVA